MNRALVPSLVVALVVVLTLGCSPAPPPLQDHDDDARGTSPTDAPDAGDDAAPSDAPPDGPGGGPVVGGDPSGCGQAAPEGGAWTLTHDGAERTFHVRIPSSYDASTPTPIVFSFHGRSVRAALQESVSGFTALGEAAGFIVVYPEGLGAEPTFNAGLCCGDAMEQDVDDLGFVDAMLERLEAELCVDPRRVFANGLSNGGFMAYALACERSDRFAAVASVAGMTGIVPCEPARPVPVLHFHGTDDAIVPYTGSGGLAFLSAQGNAADWAERDACTQGPTPYIDRDDVLCEAWSGCAQGAEVKLCTVDGGGHQWPGGASVPFLGANTDTVDATAMMWSFFEAHPL